jgi:hypothetical protein
MLRAGSGPVQGRAEDENVASVSTVSTRSKQPAQQPEKAGAAKRRCVFRRCCARLLLALSLLSFAHPLAFLVPPSSPSPNNNHHTGPSAT